MREGQQVYRNSPIYKLPRNLIPGYPEELRDVTQKMVPGVLDYYMISNYGRLWHKYKGVFLRSNIDSKGYLYKPLSTVSGKPINCRIHRLVMLAFCYFEGCEDLLVDHIDGNKTNCAIWNLQWVSNSENTQLAFQNNLIGPVLSEDKIREVCKLLEDPTCPLLRISEITGVSYTTVQAIQGKRTHTDISDQYNITPRKVTNNLNNQEVRLICQFFQDHPKLEKETVDNYCKRALDFIGYENPGYKYIKTVKKIYWKETYQYISKDYNF